LFALAGELRAQASCRANVDSVFAKIEQNYAGFRIEGANRREKYDRDKVKLTATAAATPDDQCYRVMQQATALFADPHLFIFQGARLDSQETRQRMMRVERHPVDEAALRAALTRPGRRLDPIEGIWYDRALRVAVVPDPARGTRHYLAVVLTSDTATWKPGDVRARLVRRDDDAYEVDLATRDHSRRQLEATLHRRVLLRLSPGIWGKEFPILPADSGSIDPTDVHRATWRQRGETGILAIPSHDPTYVSALQAIGEQHMAEIARLTYLIIDLRGNEGGSSWVTTPLLPLILSRTPRPSAYDTDSSVLLSSPAQVAYARRAFGSDTSAFVRSLVGRMEAAPGQLVPLRDPSQPAGAEPAAEVTERPLRVAVLVDGGTVSAAEVLVLQALRSTRAVVIGEPTAGALDYQSVNVIRLSSDENRWFLGYPTIARLPHFTDVGRMRGRGIQPDVRLRWGKTGDDYRELLRILKQ
jgi:hypothetical protein